MILAAYTVIKALDDQLLKMGMYWTIFRKMIPVISVTTPYIKQVLVTFNQWGFPFPDDRDFVSLTPMLIFYQ